MPGAIRLKGVLNLVCLQQALDAILSRHEILRTNFSMVDNQPVQIIAPPRPLPLTLIDLSDLPAKEQSAEAKRLAEEEAQRPFDLRNDLLVRASLLKVNTEEHIFLLTMHHIVSDGWSIRVFSREFAALYKAFVDGKPNPLSPLPIQYADFASWQREWLQGERLDTQLAYWKRQLGGELPQLENLLDKPRPPVQTHQSGRANLELSDGLSQALRQLSQQEDATLFMVLLAAFKLLLHRHTGLEDIIVGSPIAGRSRGETENLIGFFLNTLVLRTDLSGNPSFRELIQRVKRVAMDAYSHQDIPFEKLLVELQPERDLSRTPLFQIFFNMLNLEDNQQVPGLTIEILDLHEIGSKFDLTFYVHNWNGVLKLRLVYNKDLFSDSSMTALLAQYKHILEQIAVDADQSISTMPLMPDSEIEKFRVHIPIPDGFVPFEITDSETIASRFKHIVELFPDNLAVKTEKQHLTYKDLYRAATKVAHTLQQNHSNETRQVAILLEHDISMIIGILGIILAGKTYVPLDPSYPEQRLTYILKQSRTKYILTNERNLSLAQTLADDSLCLINMDQTFPDSAESIPAYVEPDDLAYILFTSGSTGHPKGVMQSHRNVLYHIRNYTNNLHINASDRLTLLSSYGFDASVMAIFGAILNGAALYPYDVNARGLSPMENWLTQVGITIYHSTPTLYRYFMDTLHTHTIFSQIRVVVLGGEEVIRSDFDLYKQHFPRTCYFVNGLGPTESTLALQNILTHDTLLKVGSVPVGYPVDGIDVLLLDEAGNSVPVQGEIALQGKQIALGYWEMPDLTNAVFQTASSDNTQRIYRTGDLGRILPDGRLEFLGRKDEQVKIRGFRIELGEIETTLNNHPAVKQSVVTAWGPSAADKRLLAYIVLATVQSSEVHELKDYLQKRLPSYMIPANFIRLDAIPLTPSGKIDRRALPDPDMQSNQGTKFVAPQTQLQELLAGIWADVLQLKQVGIHDNFFELGGHSLLATRIISRIRQATQIELPLRTLFEAPTIVEVSEAIDTIIWATQKSSVSRDVPTGKRSEMEI